jgi:hypothetical protein
MFEKPPVRRVEVSFVGTAPARQVERASGVSEVETEGSILRCLVCGSFQPFLEALRGHEVVGFDSAPAFGRRPPAAPGAERCATASAAPGTPAPAPSNEPPFTGTTSGAA